MNSALSIDLAVIGISHQTAPLALREAFALACHRRYKNRPSAPRLWPSVLLSTCNRCELYLPAQDHMILESLCALDTELASNWKDYLYILKHEDAFRHLCKVTSGIDSAFFGETQIQGQVKVAYGHACEQALTRDLHFSFQRALQIAKQVRLKVGIEGSSSSMQRILWKYGACAHNILFVGASQTNEIIIRDFAQRGAKNFALVNRSQSPRAQALASICGLHILPWHDLHRWPSYEVVIVATKSLHVLPEFQAQVRLPSNPTCRHIFDLSVPCNVDAGLAEQNLTIHNIDDLKRYQWSSNQQQQQQLQQALFMIDELVDRHLTRRQLGLQRVQLPEVMCAFV